MTDLNHFLAGPIKVWLAPRPPRPVAYRAPGAVLVVSEPVSAALDDLIGTEGAQAKQVIILPHALFLDALAGLEDPATLAAQADRSPLTVLGNVPQHLERPVKQILATLGQQAEDPAYVSLLSLEHLSSLSFHPGAKEAAVLIRDNAVEILRINRASCDTLFGPRFLKRPRMFRL